MAAPRLDPYLEMLRKLKEGQAEPRTQRGKASCGLWLHPAPAEGEVRAVDLLTSPCSWSPVTVWELLSSSGPQEQPSLWFITKSKAAIFLFLPRTKLLQGFAFSSCLATYQPWPESSLFKGGNSGTACW